MGLYLTGTEPISDHAGETTRHRPQSRLCTSARFSSRASPSSCQRRRLVASSRPALVFVPIGKRTATLRLGLPPRKVPDARHPLVILLHGTGGSENLFFDLYGCTTVAPCCRAVSTLAGSSWLRGDDFLAKPPLEASIDTLAKRWPIDPARVSVVGHSMGRPQARTAVHWPGAERPQLRQATKAATSSAPTSSNCRAHCRMVAPEVNTSSMSTTRRPRTRSAWRTRKAPATFV